MEGYGLCSLCRTNPAAHFCICSDFPLFCPSCRPAHEAEPDLHFLLPIEGKGLITLQNQQQYRFWLGKLKHLQEKLRENEEEMDNCRGNIEAIGRGNDGEFDEVVGKSLAILAELKAALSGKIAEAIAESSSNACFEDYRPSSYLAQLLWTQSCQQRVDSLLVFSYRISTHRQGCPTAISFQTSVPELTYLNYDSGNIEFPAKVVEKMPEISPPPVENPPETTEITKLNQKIETLKSKLSVQKRQYEDLATCYQQLQSQFTGFQKLMEQMQIQAKTQENRCKSTEALCKSLENKYKSAETLIKTLQSNELQTAKQRKEQELRAERQNKLCEGLQAQVKSLESRCQLAETRTIEIERTCGVFIAKQSGLKSRCVMCHRESWVVCPQYVPHTTRIDKFTCSECFRVVHYFG